MSIVRPSPCCVQALTVIHAAGVCLLDICAGSIWITDTGSAAFLDFSMAHEFVPGGTPSPSCSCLRGLLRRVVKIVVCLACKFEPGAVVYRATDISPTADGVLHLHRPVIGSLRAGLFILYHIQPKRLGRALNHLWRRGGGACVRAACPRADSAARSARARQRAGAAQR